MYENCSGKEPKVPVRHSPHDIRHKKRGRITEKGAQGEHSNERLETFGKLYLRGDVGIAPYILLSKKRYLQGRTMFALHYLSDFSVRLCMRAAAIVITIIEQSIPVSPPLVSISTSVNIQALPGTKYWCSSSEQA